ncbi:MAG TPA: nuclease-related domain-containing protein [Acidimicrobiales bacterium]|nr:nuclease-related domain-containing protein [Acidimicrobiales bacterium]
MARAAGTSALAMYRSARRRRRLRVLTGCLLVAGAVGGLLAGLPVSLLAGVAVVGALVVAVAMAGNGRDLDRWRRGAEGELRTAELLGALPPRGWAVWHDLQVPGSRANVDHVVVGRTGVWVVDSKSTRSQVRVGWRSVRFGDRKLETGPVVWEARVVAAELGSRLGPRPGSRGRSGEEPEAGLSMRPIVVVHGGGLRRRGKRLRGVRVVPAEALLERITQGRRRLGRRHQAAIGEAMAEAFGPPAGGRLGRGSRFFVGAGGGRGGASGGGRGGASGGMGAARGGASGGGRGGAGRDAAGTVTG